MNPQAAFVAGIFLLSVALPVSAADAAPPQAIHVAAVQMRSSRDLKDNIARIRKHLQECAAQGVRVAVFPECALSGYFVDLIPKLSAEQLADAEKQVAETCRKADIYAVVGMPYREGAKLYNSAAVFAPSGKIIERYHKVQLAERWPDPGDHLSVFKVDGVPCSIIICHDERYPELVRLPVLAGARVIFYPSHESGVWAENKIGPYRAQIQARAVENNVFVVQANAPAYSVTTGSHGQSRLIAPDGNLIGPEASIFREEVLAAKLDLRQATAANAMKSLTRGPLGDWWREGIKRVRMVEEADNPPARLPRDNLLVYRGSDGKSAPVKTVADWAKRRAEVVRGMESVMGKLPGDEKRCALDVKVEEEVDGGTFVRRLITYASEPGGRVPAYLLVPKDVLSGKKKAPAILCLHGTNKDVGHGVVVGLGRTPNRAYALELAQRGYVTLAPSYPLLAKYQPDLKKLGWESGTLKAVWDNMRGLDVLASQPFVDSSKGFGVIGHSLGGHNSVFTAVFDDRIKVVVSSCGLDSFLDYYGGDPKNWEPERGWCQTRYMRKLAGYKGRLADIPFDFHEMVGVLAPRHVFIIAPTKDSNFRADSVDRITAAARAVFKLHGHEGRLRVEHPDCGHDFPPEMREASYRLFDAVLGRATDRSTERKTYTYKTVGDLPIKADVYRLPGEDVRPALIWIHGGGLITGGRGGPNLEQRKRYLDAGYVIVSIDYRLAPETKLPGILDDVRDAIAWVRAEGPQLYKIDPKRVAIVGHSAGGYLTLMAGFAVEPRPQALVAFYGYGDVDGDWYAKPDPYYRKARPLVTKEDAYKAIGTKETTNGGVKGRSNFYTYCRQNGLWSKEVVGHDPVKQPREFDRYCPIRNVTKDYPPTLLLHGDRDTDVPYQQSVAMAAELKRAGVVHELISIKGGEHGFDAKGMKDADVSAAFDMIERFLKKHVGK